MEEGHLVKTASHNVGRHAGLLTRNSFWKQAELSTDLPTFYVDSSATYSHKQSCLPTNVFEGISADAFRDFRVMCMSSIPKIFGCTFRE